jgi:hypothetical protein
MTKREETLYRSLVGIRNEFSVVISELQKQQGVISTEILDIIDSINKLSVEV